MKRKNSLLGWLGFFVLLGLSFQPHPADALRWQTLKRKWPRLWFMKNPCKVVRVIDGDTTHVRCNGKYEKLRLVGIDTPETKHPFKPIEYFGPEASARAKQLQTKGMNVWLARNKNGQARGKYRRLLVYLFLPNGTMFNAQMIREGFAFAMRRYPHVYMQRFIQIEKKAKRLRRGMWSDIAKVNDMVAKDTQYRDKKRNCLRKRSFRGRFQWVIGDSQKRIYFTRKHRAYFRTNPTTRVLFCSVSDAQSAGYQEASGSFKPRYRRYKRRYHQPPPTTDDTPTTSDDTPTTSGTLIVADPETKTYRKYPSGTYRLFRSVRAARAAGFRARRGKRRGKRGRRSRRFAKANSQDADKCGGKPPVVGNRRSKVYRLPTQRSYKRALKSKNAVFFCSESEAKQANFRKAKR